MTQMHDRLKPPILIAVLASLLFLSTPLLLRDAGTELTGAAMIVLLVLVGAGIALGLDVDGAHHRRH